MLEDVMAGDAIRDHVRARSLAKIVAQIMVKIARRITLVSAAHTPAVAIHFSDTNHAARHDVNDPP